jgi:hypothetical protein
MYYNFRRLDHFAVVPQAWCSELDAAHMTALATGVANYQWSLSQIEACLTS